MNLSPKEQKRARRQAESELILKISLERAFKTEINSIFRQMRDAFRVSVAATGEAPSRDFMPLWEAALSKHYERVQKRFSGKVSSFNGKQFSAFLTKQDDDDEQNDAELLALALLLWRDNRTPNQARFISRTNAAQMRDALNEARQIALSEGLPLDNRTLAANASAILSRKFKARVENIATLETQATAESTKLFEAEVISGIKPDITLTTTDIEPRRVVRRTQKRWQTVGDNKVRRTHAQANGQTVDIDAPFIVGGAQLMHPGDTSLGAPLKETANCRCSAVYFVR